MNVTAGVLAAATLGGLGVSAAHAQLLAGKLAVIRVTPGGTLPLSVAGNNVVIDEYDPFASSQSAPLASLALQTATTTTPGFALPGALNGGLYNEGRMSLSDDGSALVLGGYSLKATGSNYIATTSASVNPRVVASIPLATGVPSYSAGLNVFSNASTGQAFTTVASTNGSAFYAGSATTTATVRSLAYYPDSSGGTPAASFETPTPWTRARSRSSRATCSG
jgi:hypothetical protein